MLVCRISVVSHQVIVDIAVYHSVVSVAPGRLIESFTLSTALFCCLFLVSLCFTRAAVPLWQALGYELVDDLAEIADDPSWRRPKDDSFNAANQWRGDPGARGRPAFLPPARLDGELNAKLSTDASLKAHKEEHSRVMVVLRCRDMHEFEDAPARRFFGRAKAALLGQRAGAAHGWTAEHDKIVAKWRWHFRRLHLPLSSLTISTRPESEADNRVEGAEVALQSSGFHMLLYRAPPAADRRHPINADSLGLSALAQANSNNAAPALRPQVAAAAMATLGAWIDAIDSDFSLPDRQAADPAQWPVEPTPDLHTEENGPDFTALSKEAFEAADLSRGRGDGKPYTFVHVSRGGPSALNHIALVRLTSETALLLLCHPGQLTRRCCPCTRAIVTPLLLPGIDLFLLLF